ncbi:NPC intracellular cholesterol transporter 2 [Nematostella vectensis]|uniref:NPC intracellular cholesterol transporter 2 n=1 Tax=Nematostella vectensis TaxID=45351 RepID=UPI002076FC62|nr:NPC intracellular cholesterol transporter 2 [Nematostella vectensis]
MACISLVILSLLAFASSTQGRKISFKACESPAGKLVELDLEPCEEEPCTFHKGSNETCKATFVPNELVSSATIEVFGIIGGVQVPFPLKNPNVCENHGVKCPINAGDSATLDLNIYVSNLYPSLKLIIKFELKGGDNKLVFCGEFSAQIKSKADNGKRSIEEGIVVF